MIFFVFVNVLNHLCPQSPKTNAVRLGNELQERMIKIRKIPNTTKRQKVGRPLSKRDEIGEMICASILHAY
jgi:hypothetical protein